MSHSLSQKIFRALSIQSVTIIVVALQEVFLLPIYLWGWGIELYRDWLVILAVMEFLVLLDLGLQSYFANLMMKSRSGTVPADYDRICHFAFSTYLLLTSFGVLILLSIAFAITEDELKHWLGLTLDNAHIVVLLTGLVVLVRIPMGMIGSVYRAHDQVTKSVTFELIQTFARISSIVLPILLGFGPMAVAGAMVSANLILAFFAWRDQARRDQIPYLRFMLPKLEEIKHALLTGLTYNLNALALLGTVQGMVILVAQLSANPLAVVLFTTARTLTGLARQVAIQLTAIVNIEQSRASGGGNRASLVKLHQMALRLASTVASVVTGFILIFGESLLELWTHNKVQYDARLFFILLAAVLVGVTYRAGSQFFFYTNRPGVLARSAILFALTALGLSLVTVPPWGVIGAAWSLLIAELVAVVGFLGWVIKHEFKETWWSRFAKSSSVAILGLSFSLMVAWVVYQLVGAGSWWQMLAAAIGWALLVFLPAFLLVFGRDQSISIIFKKEL